jgi:isoquinoline 1-oxidoreductase subunit beta
MHVALEPVNALAFEKNGVIEIHTGNQWQSSILPVLAKALRRSEDRILIRSYLLGGAFGRRLTGDYAHRSAGRIGRAGDDCGCARDRECNLRGDGRACPPYPDPSGSRVSGASGPIVRSGLPEPLAVNA